MPDFAAVAAQVAAASVPVLFLDTCILLDVVRAPARSISGCVEAAVELMRMADPSGRRCSLVISSLIPTEWHTHIAGTTAELTRHIEKLNDHAKNFRDTCADAGIAVPFGHADYLGVALPGHLQCISRNLLALAIALDVHQDTNQRAFDRVINKNPPARKSQELKDCTILEECLEVCRCLQAIGFQRKRVFATSNTNDYCEPGGAITVSLASEFAAVELGFVTNLRWAVHELKT